MSQVHCENALVQRSGDVLDHKDFPGVFDGVYVALESQIC